MNCPTCNGSGKQNMTVTTRESGKPAAIQKVSIRCISCGGKGDISKAEYVAITADLQHIADTWCRCEQPSQEWDFYTDGEHPALHKHHYRCQKCGKVTQSG